MFALFINRSINSICFKRTCKGHWKCGTLNAHSSIIEGEGDSLSGSSGVAELRQRAGSLQISWESDFLFVLSVGEMRGMGTTAVGGKSHFLLSQHLPPVFPIKRQGFL